MANLTLNYQTIQREAEELRRFWIEKKEHYEDKMKYLENMRKEKDSKIEELNSKAEAASKYRYQWELMKELGEEKDNKLRQAEKELLKLSSQLEEIKNNKLDEENYRLKM